MGRNFGLGEWQRENDIEGNQTLTCCKAIAGVIFYRFTLHPLAKFPGSLLAAAADGLDIYRTSTGDRHLDQLKDHDKYGAYRSGPALTFEPQADPLQGPVVRIGPNTLSFNTSGIDSSGVLAQLVATAHENVSHLSSVESSSPES